MRFILSWLLCSVLALTANTQGMAQSDSLKGLDLTLFLPAPPAPNSDQCKAEIKQMLQIQNSRTPEMVAQAKADQKESVFRFGDVLGPDFTEENLPLTSAFFKRVHHAEGDLVDPLKEYWKKPRPPQVDSRIKPCIDLPWNYSYPSGHATGGTAMSILLAHMVPEKKDALLARGVAFGENRVIGGVHFPSDVAAGRIAGALLAENILRDPAYQKDYEAALVELRKALGLAPLP